MSIEVVPAELYALASLLRAAGDRAVLASAAVPGDPVDGAVGPVVLAFCETVRTAGSRLAGELRWLGSAVAGAADSWLGLDGSLLPRRGIGVAE